MAKTQTPEAPTVENLVTDLLQAADKIKDPLDKAQALYRAATQMARTEQFMAVFEPARRAARQVGGSQAVNLLSQLASLLHNHNNQS